LTGCIAIDDKILLGIRRSKHWGRSQFVFERLETFLALFCPIKLDAFMKQVSQGLGDLGEVLDKSTAIAGESEKISDLFDILWRSPIKDSPNSLGVDGNTILGDDMAKVGYFG
jgi:hypothetical protein